MPLAVSSMTPGVLGEVGVAQLLEVLDADDPVAVGRAVEGDDLVQVGSSDLRAVSLAIWVSSSAKTTWHSESLRMYAVSSSLVVGYTVVVAAPAHMMPRSARIHS